MPPAVRSRTIVAVLSTTVLLAGCGSAGGDSATEGRELVASFYPLAWVSERVAGDTWTVQNLTKPGQESHDLTLDVAQTAAIEGADLVVLEHSLQPAVGETAESVDAAVLEVEDVLDLLPAEEHEGEHEGEEGHDHEHGDLDPHFWLDPLLMADFGDEVAAELSDIDPDGQETYEQNAATLRGDLEALDQEYADGLASCERDVTVVSHDAFTYLERHGLHFEAISGMSPDAEPTAADLAHLQELITAEGVTTVFSERLASSKMAQTLAEDLGVETAVLDPIEGLADETAEEDYLSLMRSNLTALQQANGCP